MKYRMMGLGVFAAAGLSQCQPACTPTPPAPVVTTTTAATTTTTQPQVTTTTAAPFVPTFGVDINPNADCSALVFHNKGTGELDVNIHESDSDAFVSHDLPAGADVAVSWETLDFGMGEFEGLLLEVVVVTPGNAQLPPGYQLNDGLIRKNQECPPTAATFTYVPVCTTTPGLYITAGDAEIVTQGFGPGPTPQYVIPANTGTFIEWPYIPEEEGPPSYTDEVTFDVRGTTTDELIDTVTIRFNDECPVQVGFYPGTACNGGFGITTHVGAPYGVVRWTVDIFGSSTPYPGWNGETQSEFPWEQTNPEVSFRAFDGAVRNPTDIGLEIPDEWYGQRLEFTSVKLTATFQGGEGTPDRTVVRWTPMYNVSGIC